MTLPPDLPRRDKPGNIMVYWPARDLWVTSGAWSDGKSWIKDPSIWLAILFSRHPEREFLGVCVRDSALSELLDASSLEEGGAGCNFDAGRGLEAHRDWMADSTHTSAEFPTDDLTGELLSSTQEECRLWLRTFIDGNPRCAQKQGA